MLKPPLSLVDARKLKHTVWGITCLGAGVGILAIGLLVSAVQPGFSPGWGALAALGWVLLLWDPRFLGRPHVRLAWLAFGLAVVSVGVWLIDPFWAGAPMNTGNPYPLADAYRTQLLYSTVFAILAFASLFLATLAVQDPLGRGLLAAGLGIGVAVQAVLWFQLNAEITRELTALVPVPGTSALAGFPAAWARIGWLSAIPLVVYAVAYERLYWRIRRRFFTGVSLLEV